ncbi:retrovirus-related pol polyprotein from transposon TNT 1-94 [Tanacetum coccineum]|uniref:Retrovirus-related pol polyprotein from transposon TNT 1-94 n=1 Tax=Tanacetum coccineum TaxID=301880 RepID=A0ABQ5EWX1_9ASTR
MKDDELVIDYSVRVMDEVNQMRLHGEVVKDHKFGHVERYRRAKKTHNSTQRIQQAHVSVEDQVDDEHLFMASHLDKHPDSLTWLMDSGCTSHANLIMSFFISLDTTDNPRVKLGDGHSPRPKKRASLDMVNDSYYLKLDVANTTAFTITQDDNMKWHKRFGHFNYRTLNHMYTTKLVKDICSKLGKSRKLPLSVSHVTRATHKLEIVHSDIYIANTDVLRTIPLVDVYESCNFVIELDSHLEAFKHSEWNDAMKYELEMIEKNNTWKLFGREKYNSNNDLVKEFKKQMEIEFDMSHSGLESYFLGMEIKKLPKGVHLSKRNYVSDMLKNSICSN